MSSLIDRLENAREGSTRFMHFSRKPLARPITSAEQHPPPSQKPQGFWISVEGNGDGWKDWCQGEEWNLEGLAYGHEVALRADANLLWLRNADDIDNFTSEYEAPLSRHYSYDMISWSRVAQKYQGIFISPYVWERRLHDATRWYYCWDCASGCVWDAEAIDRIAQPLTTEKEG